MPTTDKLTTLEAKVLKALIRVAGPYGKAERNDFVDALESEGADFNAVWDALTSLERKGFAKGTWQWHRWGDLPTGIEKVYQPILLTKKAREYWSQTP